MKYLETTYTEYVNQVKKHNLHKKFSKIYNKLEAFDTLKHMIFYGPSGIGKYSQVLYFIQKFSKSNLKYDKRFNIEYNNKKNYVFRMSDIHYEIDIELLGCNSRLLWIKTFNHIIDIIQAKKDNKYGFIVCKNFHLINNELLEIFYSYMKSNNNVRFILLTEHLSFIPRNIIRSCSIFSFDRPSKKLYSTITDNSKLIQKIPSSNIVNIKNIKNDILKVQNPNEAICDSIIEILVNFDNNYLELREQLYKILIFKLDVYESIWYIYKYLISYYNFGPTTIQDINKEMHRFLKYYNNNYRPIYHLERIVLYIISKADGN